MVVNILIKFKYIGKIYDTKNIQYLKPDHEQICNTDSKVILA